MALIRMQNLIWLEAVSHPQNIETSTKAGLSPAPILRVMAEDMGATYLDLHEKLFLMSSQS